MTTNSKIPKSRNTSNYTKKAHDVPKPESKVFVNKRNTIHRKDKTSITLRKGRALLREIHNPVPAISSCIDDELQVMNRFCFLIKCKKLPIIITESSHQ